MIERILEHCQTSDFDFRSYANPDDALRHLFPEWIPYYRLKAAIARAIAPATILEIGVRYGYSAAAFLHGQPSARITGIDLDVESFGGAKSAFAWAQRILPAAQTELILGDSQSMDRFPGGIYDLIHIDGQQDGDGTYRDLEKAISQGRYILVDGYFWTRPNFQAASEFLYAHRAAIDYSFVIPGYAGELLIKTKPEALAAASAASPTSASFQPLYDLPYFKRVCAGWDAFEASQGKRLTDERLRTVLDLALASDPQRVLDLGCGRGEVSAGVARFGREAIAVDHSEAALALGRTSVAGEDAARRVRWVEADATAYLASSKVDTIVIADLLEHLSPAEIDRVLARAASQLVPGGRLVFHSSTNRLHGEFDYSRKRRQAALVGAYLPPLARRPLGRNLRMSDRSPAQLRRLLRAHFPHVLFWFGGPGQPSARLVRPRELAALPWLFAVASHQPIDWGGVPPSFTSEPLSPTDVRAVTLATSVSSLRAGPGTMVELPVQLANQSGAVLCSRPPNPVFLSYHWYDALTGAVVEREGNRTPLVPSLRPGASGQYALSVRTPGRPGRYRLHATLVQEWVQWFEDTAPGAGVHVDVQIG